YKFDAFPIVADVRDTLSQLTESLSDYRSQFTDLATIKEAWQKERQRLAHTNYDAPAYVPEVKNQFDAKTMAAYAEKLQTHLTQTEAVIAVNNTIDPTSIIVAAAGSLPGDVQRIWDPVVPNTYHMEYGYSMMGYEVPAALGIKLAQPDQESYALVGDGSFMMLHSELVTALQYHKKINILVFDNSGFASINNLQMAQGSNSYLTEFRTADNDIMKTDFAKIAEGYGAKAYRANDRKSLIAAIEDAKKQTVSTLIDIKVLPKTMTQGYGQSWWRVGVSEISNNPKVQKAYQDIQTGIDKAFKY
ncbi:MAG: thiamine pyrophosphate-dependent enzyme, partial [Lacticaseibacillus paracasei]|nr:thiamine pyrophosphate-dependent enzyme [Lacticaseibacillus paracasei]